MLDYVRVINIRIIIIILLLLIDYCTVAYAPFQHQQQARASMTLDVVVDQEWRQRAQRRHCQKLNFLVLSRRPITCRHRRQRRPNGLVGFYVRKQRWQHLHLCVNLQQYKHAGQREMIVGK